RNEAPDRYKSSELIRQADAIADFCWPGARHYTKVNSKAVRSTNPGYCFLKAGWQRCGMTQNGKLILERPAPTILPQRIRELEAECERMKDDIMEDGGVIADLKQRAEKAEAERDAIEAATIERCEIAIASLNARTDWDEPIAAALDAIRALKP